MTKINSLSLEKIKKNSKFVEKKDGINISNVIFPHNMQIGLADSAFQSELVVKGEIKGHIYTLSDGTSYLVAGENIDIVSGSGDSNSVVIAVKEDIIASTLSGSLTKLNDGKSYLVAGTNVTITSASNGQITISSSGGGGGSQNLFDTISVAGQSDIEADTTTDSLTFVAGSNMSITTNAGTDSVTFSPTITGSFNAKYPADRPSTFVTTSSVAIVGPEGGFNNDISTYRTDLYFYVSGSVGSAETSIQGASMFGGDVIVSGSLHVTDKILPNSTPSDGQVIAWNNTTKKLYWKTAVVGFAFASAISQFTTSETSMIAFAASNAFDPITNGTTVVGTVATT